MPRVSVHVRGDPGAKLTLSSGAVRVVDGPAYEGEYEVTPSVDRQELLTEGKQMENNVVVLGIPCSVTDNEEGGFTVSIAS